ncbi:type II toxin-antitoxin system PemK/MazF family toxin [bacterium]|nr:MAG: type II toxin-antitoxin system PemK/MazF family toxin [bacterium]
MSKFRAGQIVVVDWRDGKKLEANKTRPAVVVEDDELFDDSWPAVLLAPLTDEGPHVIRALSVPLDPSTENGCTKRCYVAAHLVTATAVSRVRATPSRVTEAELRSIREKIAQTIGLDQPMRS